MTTQSFKDLLVWRKSSDMAVVIYKQFGSVRDYGFRDQIQRASVSIMNNVAEGHGRRSDRSFRSFLVTAKGSVSEIESMLVLAERLGYITNESFERLNKMSTEVGKMLTGFIAKLPAKDY